MAKTRGDKTHPDDSSRLMSRRCARTGVHPPSWPPRNGLRSCKDADELLTVIVEDAEELDWTAMGAKGVRGHGREFRCLTRLHEDGPLASCKLAVPESPVNHSLPGCTGALAPRFEPLVRREPWQRSPRGDLVPGASTARWSSQRDIALGPDDDVVVIHRFQQLIERGPLSPRDGEELIESNSSVACLDSAQVWGSGDSDKRGHRGTTLEPLSAP